MVGFCIISRCTADNVGSFADSTGIFFLRSGRTGIWALNWDFRVSSDPGRIRIERVSFRLFKISNREAYWLLEMLTSSHQMLNKKANLSCS